MTTNVSLTSSINVALDQASTLLSDINASSKAAAKLLRTELTSGSAIQTARGYISWSWLTNPAMAFNPKDPSDAALQTAVKKADQAVKDLNKAYGIGGSNYVAPALTAAIGVAAAGFAAFKQGFLGNSALGNFANLASTQLGQAWNVTASIAASTVSKFSSFSTAGLVPSSSTLMLGAGIVTAVGFAAFHAYKHVTTQPTAQQK